VRHLETIIFWAVDLGIRKKDASICAPEIFSCRGFGLHLGTGVVESKSDCRSGMFIATTCRSLGSICQSLRYIVTNTAGVGLASLADQFPGRIISRGRGLRGLRPEEDADDALAD
jgi:hypothetical protein